MLTSNQHGNRLYWNKGNLQFQDITVGPELAARAYGPQASLSPM
jgi:hypothetical protein